MIRFANVADGLIFKMYRCNLFKSFRNHNCWLTFLELVGKLTLVKDSLTFIHIIIPTLYTLQLCTKSLYLHKTCLVVDIKN